MRRTGTSARRRLTAAAALASIALLASACTGSPDDGAGDDPNAETTLTFWHGWSAPSEVAAIKENIASFEKAHPNIKVKMVKGITDDKINQGLRAGGSKAPDVVSSFTTDNVGRFCTSGALADLKPFLDKSSIDPAKTFLPQMAKYTEHDGKRCTVPLLGDAYGLYYNKDAFAEAGIKAPPKTLSEFDRIAKKLTKTKGDGYSQLGFMPNYLGYETTVEHYGGQFGVQYMDKDGKSNTAKDPAVKKMFAWQKNLVQDLGGYQKLNRYRTSLGDEWGAKHPFHTGQVAMQLDGEWRGKMAADAGLDFKIGAAPFPVPDDQVDEYGKGYLSGTILGIARTSEKKNAAWELVKYLSTDTDAVVSFANAIHNVPSTLKALDSPKLEDDPLYRTFVDIAKHPKSSHAPSSVNGGAFLLTLQDNAVAYEKGKETDLDAMLKKNDAQVDKDNEQAQ
ncbi:ABC transporter substrate-binding protein [Streptomyces triticagri]|uniref:Probable sugar-binding periplasmic protein n=1 Tax=Streptomyces triticagri TaxID=2293568 RepID=A0A372M2Z1_9ACTN|nr:ABC transporter substrate-binding protein [Streptomyces triticagri]RFU84895.1 ABC transporter substrate-binding protein [Streptomyces triticagri]